MLKELVQAPGASSSVQAKPQPYAGWVLPESELSGTRNARMNDLRPPSLLSRIDFVWMTCGFLAMLGISVALGHGRIFWEDEMLGWMILTDPSWHHMVRAWKLGADGGGFAFYLTCRAWLHLFGQSETAFRLYSATCFGLSFLVNWVTARRFYARWVVAFALFNTYLFSPPIVLHLVEGRFYGLLLLSVSLAFWLAVRVQEWPLRLPPRYCLLAFAIHALLTTSHLLGVVYSFFMVLGLAMLDRMTGRWRPLLYASAALSWLLLLPELPAIRASAHVGKPWFWTFPPTAIRIVGAYTAFSGEVIAVLLALLLLAAFTAWRRRLGTADLRLALRLRRPVYAMTAALLLVPISFLLEGRFGPSLFINRYLIPMAIATAFLTAEALQWIDWQALLPRSWRASVFARGLLGWLGSAAFAAAAAWFIFVHLPPFIMAQQDYTGKLSALFPKGANVLLEDAWSFTEVIGRQHSSGIHFLYPLDWAQSTDPRAPRLEVTQYNLMKNWRDAGYFSGSVVDLPQFVHQHDSFFVVDGQYVNASGQPFQHAIGNPLVFRFAHTPGYTVRGYASLDRHGLVLTAWLVSHDPARTGMPQPSGFPD